MQSDAVQNTRKPMKEEELHHTIQFTKSCTSWDGFFIIVIYGILMAVYPNTNRDVQKSVHLQQQ